MSKTIEGNMRERKSKAKLDRLLEMKNAILESLHLLSGHDRAVTKKSNTMSNIATSGYMYSHRKDWTPSNRVDIIRPPNNSFHVVPVLMDPNSQLQNSCQTWPQTLIDLQNDPCRFDEKNLTQKSDDRSSNPHNLKKTQVSQCQRELEQTKPSKGQGHAEVAHSWSSGSKRSINLGIKDQQIQTENNNVDIMRYLNQINDMSWGTRYSTDLPRRSVCFSPLYDTYEDRFSYQPVPPERLYRSREYTTFPNTADLWYDQSYTEAPHQHDLDSLDYGAPFSQESRITEQIHLDQPSQDSGSVFSSETDSDFVFYPCTTLTESFRTMGLVDAKRTSFLSTPPDLPENIRSWRSEWFASSLDDLTQQFFYDDDALSDDVFVDEPMVYPGSLCPENTRVLKNRDISHSFENPLYDSPKIPQDTMKSLKQSAYDYSSDSDYTYRYADIDEVLHSYNHSSCQNRESEGTCFLADVTNEIQYDNETSLTSIDLDIEISKSSESSCEQTKESHDLAHMFDSLRRNSTQSKARKMWRQRRARAKKNKSCTDEAVDSSSALALKYGIPTGEDTKPLKGILKNKEVVSQALLEDCVRCTHTDEKSENGEHDVANLTNQFEDNNKHYHFISVTADNGQDDLVAVRKNSLDKYKWSQSLHRHKKRQARKAKLFNSLTTL